MKKLFPLVLSFIMLISLTACSVEKTKKVYDASKAAYTNIKAAYEIVDAFGSDVYEAWRIGIFEDDEFFSSSPCYYLASELNLSSEDIAAGIDASLAYSSDYKDYISGFENILSIAIGSYITRNKDDFEDDLFSWCVNFVTNAYSANGKVEETQRYLDEARTQMKSITKIYSDYEHYPSLKGFYTTTSSFLDYCREPTGSFEQMKVTMEDYRSTAKDYIADLDYIFEY